MKITKGRIRQIIAEEIAALEEKDGPHFNAKLHTFLADKLGEELGSLIAGAVEDYAPQSHKDRIAALTDEMIVMESESEDPRDLAVQRAIARIEKETGERVGLSHLPKPKLAKVPYREPYVVRDPVDARYGRYPGRSGKGKLCS